MPGRRARRFRGPPRRRGSSAARCSHPSTAMLMLGKENKLYWMCGGPYRRCVLPIFLTGLGSGASLIIAIGAQNAFVLRQGLRREHVLPVVALCVLSDLVLIAAGTAGLGALVTGAPALLTGVRWAGGLFLLTLAALAAKRALRPGGLDPASGAGASSARSAVGTSLALTWLNPHVYLDTVLLLGSL